MSIHIGVGLSQIILQHSGYLRFCERPNDVKRFLREETFSSAFRSAQFVWPRWFGDSCTSCHWSTGHHYYVWLLFSFCLTCKKVPKVLFWTLLGWFVLFRFWSLTSICVYNNLFCHWDLLLAKIWCRPAVRYQSYAIIPAVMLKTLQIRQFDKPWRILCSPYSQWAPLSFGYVVYLFISCIWIVGCFDCLSGSLKHYVVFCHPLFLYYWPGYFLFLSLLWAMLTSMSWPVTPDEERWYVLNCLAVSSAAVYPYQEIM